VERDKVFKELEDEILTLDLYRQAGALNKPVLVLVHGGSWRGGDKSDWAQFAPRLATSGFLVVVPNYRLASPGADTIFPDPLEDVRDALQWTRENARSYGGDPHRIGMIGASAGAHLALLNAISGELRPDAVATFSPPADLARLYREGIAADAISALLGCTPQECPDTYHRASPVFGLDDRTPPVFLAYSRREILPLEHSRTLRRRLEVLDVRHRAHELNGSAHGLALGRRVFPQTVDFMRNVLSER
jgi:acetyl esterase/lipase